jgi:hypothetical protein
MKFIDTTDHLLGSFGSPTQLDVLTLEAYMLAPSDEVVRKEIRTTTGIEYANRHRDLLPSDFFRDLSRTFSDAKPLRMVREDSRAPFVGGIIAGAILHHAIGTTIEGLKGNSVSFAVSELSNRFKSGYSRATIHNLWREFKKVSHYWAAYVSAGLCNNSGAPDFPCTVDSLAHFVATADAFRELGQSTRAWKSKETTILPRECLRLDCGFELPNLACRPQIFFFSKPL